MGRTEVTVNLVADSSEVSIRATADIGATYSVFPRVVLESLRVQPLKRMELSLAGGRIIHRDLGFIRVRIEDDLFPVPVLFGELEDATVLGLTALETFSLTVDPVNRRLVQTRALWL